MSMTIKTYQFDWTSVQAQSTMSGDLSACSPEAISIKTYQLDWTLVQAQSTMSGDLSTCSLSIWLNISTSPEFLNFARVIDHNLVGSVYSMHYRLE